MDRTARIIRGMGGEYILRLEDGKIERAKVRGIFRHHKRSVKPMVGDIVVVRENDDPLVKFNIVDFLPRKNSLIRPAISNIDKIFIFFSIVDPKIDLFLLDKILASILAQEINVSIVFSKIDLLDAEQLKEWLDYLTDYYCLTGLALYFISQVEDSSQCFYLAEDEVCMGQLFDKVGLSGAVNDKDYLKNELLFRRERLLSRSLSSISYKDFLKIFKESLKGNVFAISGVSGSGKSTFFNNVFGCQYMETQNTSSKLEKGRNTTRHIELKPICDGYLADTPGFEKIDIEKIIDDGDILEFVYPEFRDYHNLCKFGGCKHINEPNCAVKELSKVNCDRYKNYCILRQLIDEYRIYKK